MLIFVIGSIVYTSTNIEKKTFVVFLSLELDKTNLHNDTIAVEPHNDKIKFLISSIYLPKIIITPVDIVRMNVIKNIIMFNNDIIEDILSKISVI